MANLASFMVVKLLIITISRKHAAESFDKFRGRPHFPAKCARIIGVRNVLNDYIGAVQSALDVARKALRKKLRSPSLFVPQGVGAYGDLTFLADKVVEKAVIRNLTHKFPDCLVVSEEAGRTGKPSGSPVILLDPIDGSVNASRQIPFYSSAIAVSEGRGFREIRAAGIVDLVHGDTIVGGEGSVLVNSQSAEPSHRRSLKDAFVCVDFKPRTRREGITRGLWQLLRDTRYLRLMGSAALEIAHVASGRIDAFLEPERQLRTFDCLPALFLVRSAGGYVDFLGLREEEIDLVSNQRLAFLAAGNAGLGRTILKTLRREWSL